MPRKSQRLCGYCRGWDHFDRWDARGRAVCPRRRADDARYVRREAARRRRAGIPAGPCDFCGAEPKQVKIIGRRGAPEAWAGPKCADVFEQLSRMLGGNPKRMPLMTTIRGGRR